MLGKGQSDSPWGVVANGDMYMAESATVGVAGMSEFEAIQKGLTVVKTADELEDALIANKNVILFNNIDHFY